MKVTLFQALPELWESGGTSEFLRKCVFLIFYMCEYVSLLFSQFWFPLHLKYIFSLPQGKRRHLYSYGTKYFQSNSISGVKNPFKLF